MKLTFWTVALAGALGAVYLACQTSEPPAATQTAVSNASEPAQGRTSRFDALARAMPVPLPTSVADAPPVWIGSSGRAVQLHGQTVAQYLSQWEHAARMGDPQAAYQAYLALSICATEQEPSPAPQDAYQRAQFDQEYKAVGLVCTNISPALVQERMHFLGTAAKAGVREAQIDFYMEGPNGKTINLAKTSTDPTVLEWKADALHYLQMAGAHGEPFAFGLLANAYYTGTLAPRDAKLALTYAAAEAQLRHHELTQAQVQRRYQAMLNPAEMALALSEGKDMAQRCCS